MMNFRTGAGAASVVAALALASLATPTSAQGHAAKETKVQPCYGINSCKGTSDCKTATNECKGLNECKGHGFKDITAEQCKAMGGSLTAPKK